MPSGDYYSNGNKSNTRLAHQQKGRREEEEEEEGGKGGGSCRKQSLFSLFSVPLPFASHVVSDGPICHAHPDGTFGHFSRTRTCFSYYLLVHPCSVSLSNAQEGNVACFTIISEH